jgi:hypothetical protein
MTDRELKGYKENTPWVFQDILSAVTLDFPYARHVSTN